jgi:hypothetical protein
MGVWVSGESEREIECVRERVKVTRWVVCEIDRVFVRKYIHVCARVERLIDILLLNLFCLHLQRGTRALDVPL